MGYSESPLPKDLMAKMGVARLLLVDDNRDNLEILAVLLSEKYRVAPYGSAAEALAALDTLQPDVLVLDIGMAPVDGLQCLAAIRAQPGYSATPAVALTAFARDSERAEFLAAGFQQVVTKPILDPGVLMRAIEAALESRGPRPLRARPAGGDPVLRVAS
jgi:CheY-like chemotaxis protein